MSPNTRFLPIREKPGELSFGEMELASERCYDKILGVLGSLNSWGLNAPACPWKEQGLRRGQG